MQKKLERQSERILPDNDSVTSPIAQLLVLQKDVLV